MPAITEKPEVTAKTLHKLMEESLKAKLEEIQTGQERVATVLEKLVPPPPVAQTQYPPMTRPIHSPTSSLNGPERGGSSYEQEPSSGYPAHFHPTYSEQSNPTYQQPFGSMHQQNPPLAYPQFVHPSYPQFVHPSYPHHFHLQGVVPQQHMFPTVYPPQSTFPLAHVPPLSPTSTQRFYREQAQSQPYHNLPMQGSPLLAQSRTMDCNSESSPGRHHSPAQYAHVPAPVQYYGPDRTAHPNYGNHHALPSTHDVFGPIIPLHSSSEYPQISSSCNRSSAAAPPSRGSSIPSSYLPLDSVNDVSGPQLSTISHGGAPSLKRPLAATQSLDPNPSPRTVNPEKRTRLIPPNSSIETSMGPTTTPTKKEKVKILEIPTAKGVLRLPSDKVPAHPWGGLQVGNNCAKLVSVWDPELPCWGPPPDYPAVIMYDGCEWLIPLKYSIRLYKHNKAAEGIWANILKHYSNFEVSFPQCGIQLIE